MKCHWQYWFSPIFDISVCTVEHIRQIQEPQDYHKQQPKVNACIFFQMWTNWGLNFESILSGTRDQKSSADFSSINFTFILSHFQYKYMNLCKQHSVADLLENLVGKAQLSSYITDVLSVFLLKLNFHISFNIF